MTYNRNLVVFRSLTKFMAKAGIIDRDPIDDEPNAADDSDEGARAATLEEARRHIAFAQAASISDGRSKCPRDLVWGLMYSAGLRSHEPETLVWSRHVFIDDPVPHLLFTKDINKNGRLEEVPLTGELVAMLKIHRENMRKIALAKPVNIRRNRETGEMTTRVVSPDDAAGMVFPWAPSRPTFKSDRDKAGIEREDRRGRQYSPHSARKYFETQLIESGVHARAIDRLMRHKGGVEARYRDLSMASLAESLKKLPTLWPVATCGSQNGVDNPAGLNPGLTIDDHRGTNGVASPEPLSTTSIKPRRPSDAASDWQERAVSERARGLLDLEQPGGSLASGPRVRSSVSTPTMPIVGLITVDRIWLAEVLETTARLLREGAADASPAPPRTIPKPRRRRSA